MAPAPGRTHGACRRRWPGAGPGRCDDSDRSGGGGRVAAWPLRAFSRASEFTCWRPATRRSFHAAPKPTSPCLDEVRFSPCSFLITSSMWSRVSSGFCSGVWTLARCRRRLPGSTCACRATVASAVPHGPSSRRIARSPSPTTEKPGWWNWKPWIRRPSCGPV